VVGVVRSLGWAGCLFVGSSILMFLSLFVPSCVVPSFFGVSFVCLAFLLLLPTPFVWFGCVAPLLWPGNGFRSGVLFSLFSVIEWEIPRSKYFPEEGGFFNAGE